MIDFNIIEFFLEIGAVAKCYFQMCRQTIWIFPDMCSCFKNAQKTFRPNETTEKRLK